MRYEKEVIIRCKIDANKLGIESIYDLEDMFPDLFDNISNKDYFRIYTSNNNSYLDYIVDFEEFKSANSDQYICRELTDEEVIKYLTIFSYIYPDVTKEELYYKELYRKEIIIC